MKKNLTRHALLGAAGLVLSLASHAGTPTLLSEREMDGLYGQGLTAPTIDALARVQDARANGPSSEPSGTSMPGVLLAALSGDAARGLERQLAVQELQAASGGLQNTINLSRLMVDASRFQPPMAALSLPMLNLPFLFGFPALPTLPPPKDSNGGGH